MNKYATPKYEEAYANYEEAYANFVFTKLWEVGVEKIKEASPIVAKLINKYGIAEKVLVDGQYDFESGQLLAGVRNSARIDKEIDEKALESEIEKAYDLIVELAKSYARYVIEYE